MLNSLFLSFKFTSSCSLLAVITQSTCYYQIARSRTTLGPEKKTAKNLEGKKAKVPVNLRTGRSHPRRRVIHSLSCCLGCYNSTASYFSRVSLSDGSWSLFHLSLLLVLCVLYVVWDLQVVCTQILTVTWRNSVLWAYIRLPTACRSVRKSHATGEGIYSLFAGCDMPMGKVDQLGRHALSLSNVLSC